MHLQNKKKGKIIKNNLAKYFWTETQLRNLLLKMKQRKEDIWNEEICAIEFWSKIIN